MPIWQPEEVIFPPVRADGWNMNAFFSVKGFQRGRWELFTSEPPCFTLCNWTALSINIYIRLVRLSSSEAKLSFRYGVKTFRTKYLGFFLVVFVLFCWDASKTSQTMKYVDWVCVMFVHFNNWSRRWEASGSLTQHLHKWPQNNGAVCNGSKFLVQERDVGSCCYPQTER